MTRTVTQYGLTFEATDTTPLVVSALAQFLCCGRASIDRNILRGYKLAYGTRTTARHYLTWLENNPVPRQATVAKAKLAHELQRLK